MIWVNIATSRDEFEVPYYWGMVHQRAYYKRIKRDDSYLLPPNGLLSQKDFGINSEFKDSKQITQAQLISPGSHALENFLYWWRVEIGSTADADILGALRAICIHVIDEDAKHDTATSVVNRKKTLELLFGEYITQSFGKPQHLIELCNASHSPKKKKLLVLNAFQIHELPSVN